MHDIVKSLLDEDLERASSTRSEIRVFAALQTSVGNGFAEVFIADNLDRRYDAFSYARKFLEERIQQLKVKLEDSEKQLVQYAEQQGIINLDDRKSLASTDLEAINTKLAEARNARIKLELLWNQAQATVGFGLQQILDSSAFQDNRKLRTELGAEYQQKLGLFKPAFPLMVQLRKQIQELDRQAKSEVQAIKDSIESQYKAAKNEEQAMASQLEKTNPLKNVDLRIVPRASGSTDRVLRVEFASGRTAFSHLYQILRLSPGSYVLSGEAKAENLDNEGGLVWRLYCISKENTLIAESSRITGTAAWGAFDKSFAVPPVNCDTQQLRLELNARAVLDQQISGRAFYDNIAIVPRKETIVSS